VRVSQPLLVASTVRACLMTVGVAVIVASVPAPAAAQPQPAAGAGGPTAAGAAQPQQRPPTQRVAVVPAPGPQQPPPLSPEQQAALDRLLAAWEARNAAVATWSCTFHKWEYNAWSPADGGGERLAFSESTGEIKYAPPTRACSG